MHLARGFIERATELGYKGKKRDDAAMDYFTGATYAAQLAGDEDLRNYLVRMMALLISTRGYSEIVAMSKEVYYTAAKER